MIELKVVALTPSGRRCEYLIDFPENKGLVVEKDYFDGYDYNLFKETLSSLLAVNDNVINLVHDSLTLEMDENGKESFISNEAFLVLLRLDSESYKFWNRKRIIDDIT